MEERATSEGAIYERSNDSIRAIAIALMVIRRSQRVTQVQLSRGAAIHPSMLRKLESGERFLSPEVFRAICRASNIDMSEFVEIYVLVKKAALIASGGISPGGCIRHMGERPDGRGEEKRHGT